jgi:hypothetical protein
MSLVDKIIYKTPEEAIQLISAAYAEKQALDSSILSNPDLKAALVGALLGSGVGGIGSAISAAKNRNKVTLNDLLRGALLGAVPGATAGYVSKSMFDVDPGSVIMSGIQKTKEKAKELKKSLFDKKEKKEPSKPEDKTPPPKIKFQTNEEMKAEAERLRLQAEQEEYKRKHPFPGNEGPSMSALPENVPPANSNTSSKDNKPGQSGSTNNSSTNKKSPPPGFIQTIKNMLPEKFLPTVKKPENTQRTFPPQRTTPDKGSNAKGSNAKGSTVPYSAYPGAFPF